MIELCPYEISGLIEQQYKMTTAQLYVDVAEIVRRIMSELYHRVGFTKL